MILRPVTHPLNPIQPLHGHMLLQKQIVWSTHFLVLLVLNLFYSGLSILKLMGSERASPQTRDVVHVKRGRHDAVEVTSGNDSRIGVIEAVLSYYLPNIPASNCLVIIRAMDQIGPDQTNNLVVNQFGNLR